MEPMRGAVLDAGPDLSHEKRDACLHTLGAMHAAGKLSLSELDARIEAAFAATTDEELAALVRESPRIEVTTPQPTREEPTAEVAPQPAPRGDWLVVPRMAGAVALTILVGTIKVLALTVAALCVVLVRALVVAVRVAQFAYRALVRRSRTWRASLGGAEASAAPTRLQLKRAPSRELVLAPRAQVPAQRQPVKVHPVIVPTEADASPAPSVRVIRTTAVVPAQRTALDVFDGDLTSRDQAGAGAGEDRKVRVLVSQLRPLVHRVTDRARWRRLTINACERAAHSKGLRRTTRLSRTSF